jgi:23S rRNA (cytosine1962-C5)-methyltransferase
MDLLTPTHWMDYELIDSGGLEKLERFGKYILTRPEPQAVWDKGLGNSEWEKLSHAVFKRTKGIDPSRVQTVEKGEWQKKPGVSDQWYIGYTCKGMKLKFRLGLTSYGHIGIFPEQAVNWDYIFDFIDSAIRRSLFAVRHSLLNISSEKRKAKSEKPPFSVLNLFAYTGGASLAAKAAGADVVHVDSVKPVINWARENMEACSLNDIRWVVEDALKFVRREVKRGNKFNGIILDPPAYGRGPAGEKWVLQDSISEMIRLCSELLAEKNSFFMLSLYSMGFSSLINESLVTTFFGEIPAKESGELFFADRKGRKLPLGTFVRFHK